MKDALESALNNTYAIPRASPTKLYRPRLSNYDVSCDQLNLQVSANVGNDSIFLPNAGCANLTIFPSYTMDTNLTGSYFVQESKSRSKIVIPGIGTRLMPFETVAEAALLLRLKITDQDFCVLQDKNLQIFFGARIGLSSPPLTVVTRCQHPSGEMVILAASTVRFSVPDPKMFRTITTSIFETQDELLSSMEASVNNGTLINQSADRLAQVTVMEIKIIGTEVSVLMCIGNKQDFVPRLVCVYAIVNILITKARPANPDITQKFPENGISSVAPNVAIIITLIHLPTILQKKPSFAVPKILNSSSITAVYFALLGQNFVLDWEASMLYIAYDTVEIFKGYEIPAGLFHSMVGVIVVCIMFCVATEYFVEARYKRSLFWQVSQELVPPESKNSPQLLRFDTTNLEFEGRRIVSTKAPQMLKETAIYQRLVVESQNPLV
ncbi:hypothetical protein BGZ96_000636 [Linnemannia gamsii]|uniref:Uncharacterized protein n=1 Tax=Linnemannia gamsii TaxID=64522 RepID=A0ABQ7JNY3_9FUNG|nr:hypothetical protein BGZ96_000636 [Linnemannia gamsii]